MKRISAVIVWTCLVCSLAACAREQPPVASPRQASQAKVQSNLDSLSVSLDALGLVSAGAESKSIARLREQFRDLPCAVPDELALLLARVDEAHAPRIDGWNFLGSEAALSAHDSLRTHHDWRPNWIPFARSASGWLVVESSRGTSPAGPVLEVDADHHAQVKFLNLTRLAQDWAAP